MNCSCCSRHCSLTPFFVLQKQSFPHRKFDSLYTNIRCAFDKYGRAFVCVCAHDRSKQLYFIENDSKTANSHVQYIRFVSVANLFGNFHHFVENDARPSAACMFAMHKVYWKTFHTQPTTTAAAATAIPTMEINLHLPFVYCFTICNNK